MSAAKTRHIGEPRRYCANTHRMNLRQYTKISSITSMNPHFCMQDHLLHLQLCHCQHQGQHGTTCFRFNRRHMAADVHRQLNIEAMILTRNVCACLCSRCSKKYELRKPHLQGVQELGVGTSRECVCQEESSTSPAKAGTQHRTSGMVRSLQTECAVAWTCCALPHTLRITSNHNVVMIKAYCPCPAFPQDVPHALHKPFDLLEGGCSLPGAHHESAEFFGLVVA